MNNTALRAGLLSASGTCLATTEAERRPQSANKTHMVFANEEHKKFYYEKIGAGEVSGLLSYGSDLYSRYFGGYKKTFQADL